MDYRRSDESHSSVKREAIASTGNEIDGISRSIPADWPETHDVLSHRSEPQYPGNMTLTVDPSDFSQSTTWGLSSSIPSFTESNYNRHSTRYDATPYAPVGYPPVSTASPAMLWNDPEGAGMDYQVPLTESTPAVRVEHGSGSSYPPVMPPTNLPSIDNIVPHLRESYPAHRGSTFNPSVYSATSQASPYLLPERQHPGRQNLPHFFSPSYPPQHFTLPPIQNHLERFDNMSPAEELSRSSASPIYGPTSLSEPPSTHGRPARHDPQYPSPPFGSTKMVRDIYNSLGAKVMAELSARMVTAVKPKHDDGFWTVYRRNYFNIESCSYRLSTSNVRTDGKLYLQKNSNGVSKPIEHLSIGISARVGSEDGQIMPLKAFNKQREIQPGPNKEKMRPNMPSSDNKYPFPTGENTQHHQRPSLFSFERIQFSRATQNNGSRRQHQQHFHLIVELYATHTGSNGVQMNDVIATIVSDKILVRGRSPSSFSEEDDDPDNPRRQPRKPRNKNRRLRRLQARARNANAAAAPANAHRIGSANTTGGRHTNRETTSTTSKSASVARRSSRPSDSVSGLASEDTKLSLPGSLPALDNSGLDRFTATELHWPSNLQDISEEAGGWMSSHDDAKNNFIIDAVRSARQGNEKVLAGSDLSKSTGVNTPSSRTSSFPPLDQYERTVGRSGASCAYELIQGPNARPVHPTLKRENNLEDTLALASQNQYDGYSFTEMGPGFLDELNFSMT